MEGFLSLSVRTLNDLRPTSITREASRSDQQEVPEGGQVLRWIDGTVSTEAVQDEQVLSAVEALEG